MQTRGSHQRLATVGTSQQIVFRLRFIATRRRIDQAQQTLCALGCGACASVLRTHIHGGLLGQSAMREDVFKFTGIGVSEKYIVSV